VIEKYKDLPRSDPSLLYAEDLQGRAVTLVIEDILYEQTTDFTDNKVEMLTLRFKGKKKRLRLCKTNVRLFWALFGKDDAKKPLGQQLTLQAMKVDAFGEVVDAIRIKGAPWLSEPLAVTVPQGKKKVRMRLVPTPAGAQQAAPKPSEPESPPAEDAPPPGDDAWMNDAQS
jgi:hypothetical protein